MKILLTGCSGQIGYELERSLQTLGEVGYARIARRGRAWARFNSYTRADPSSGFPVWQQLVEEIQAEMVSSVWKVLVEAGAQVAAGDTLVILESMKMEIPVLTETGGTVTAVKVSEGDVVQEGDVLVTLDL